MDNHNVGRRYIGMARMPVSRNTFSKPPNSQTKDIKGAISRLGLLALLLMHAIAGGKVPSKPND